MSEELTEDEREELNELRAAKMDRDKEESFANIRVDQSGEHSEVSARDEDELPMTHWLTLADGRTVESKGTMTHYDGVPVLYSTPIPNDPADAQPAHRF